MGLNDTDLYGQHYEEEERAQRLERARRVDAYVRFGLAWSLVALSLAVLVLVFVVIAKAQQGACDDMSRVQWDGELIVPNWINEDVGWNDIGVDTLVNAPMLKLPWGEGEYWLYETSGGALVVFPFWDVSPTTDAFGEHFGAHMFCEPFIWYGR